MFYAFVIHSGIDFDKDLESIQSPLPFALIVGSQGHEFRSHTKDPGPESPVLGRP